MIHETLGDLWEELPWNFWFHSCFLFCFNWLARTAFTFFARCGRSWMAGHTQKLLFHKSTHVTDSWFITFCDMHFWGIRNLEIASLNWTVFRFVADRFETVLWWWECKVMENYYLEPLNWVRPGAVTENDPNALSPGDLATNFIPLDII